MQTGVPALSRFGVGHPPSSSGGVFHDVEAIAQLLNTPDFGLVESRDGLLLFERNADLERVLNQRVSTQSLDPPESLPYDFENGIGLQEIQVTPLGERRFQMHFTWVATSAWEPGRSLFAVSRLEGVAQARIVHLPTQTLYPTVDWSPGERIVEDFEIVLPPGLAAGQYTVWTGWYDSHHFFAADTDTRSRVGEELPVGTLQAEER